MATLNLDPFLGTFGLPPSTWISDEMIVNSMPVMEIIPCKPSFDSGLNLFRIDEDTTTFSKILANHGFITPTPIRVAFIADNFPTDSFTNDYGETFLQKFTDVASQGMSQLAQMTGSKTGTQAIQKLGGAAALTGEQLGGALGGIVSGTGEAAMSVAGGLDKMLQNMNNGQSQGLASVMGGGANLVNKMIAGHRVDFPQVWRNSGYTPSYTATIRLYNPHPGNKTATQKYIVGPLAVLLLLALPRSTDGTTYNWPFFHKIKAHGIYNLDPSVITNVTVIKGGDQQQIAYNQKMAMVDVRIDFTSLYGSILVEEGNTRLTNRPTLQSYLTSLNTDDERLSTKRNDLRRVTGFQAGVFNDPPTTRNESLQQQSLIANNNAARQKQAPLIEETLANGRVSTVNAQRQLLLQSENPTIG